MTRTALVRNSTTRNLKIFRSSEYRTQSEMAQDLRGNGFRVLKIGTKIRQIQKLIDGNCLTENNHTAQRGCAGRKKGRYVRFLYINIKKK